MMVKFTPKEPMYLANQPNKAVWLTQYQIYCVEHRLFKQSGLDLDTYMSLIDPNYPTY